MSSLIIGERGIGTAQCFVCGEPSVSYTGHIHVDGEMILLGWCGAHERNRHNCDSPTPAEPHCTGCYGRIFLSRAALKEGGK